LLGGEPAILALEFDFHTAATILDSVQITLTWYAGNYHSVLAGSGLYNFQA
jgi:hypothetical protein